MSADHEASPTRFVIDLTTVPEGQGTARFALPLTPLVGRDAERAYLSDLLRDSINRLITVTGAPGVGKTRLMLTVANDVMPLFSGGARLFDGTSVASPAAAAGMLVSTLKALVDSDATDIHQLAKDLGPQRRLLLMDSPESIVPARYDILALLAHLPMVTLVLASRTILNVQGERVVTVAPFDLPDPSLPLDALSENHAVRLFVDRANAIRPPFELTAANVNDVCTICRRLEGLPLALELAAARTRLYPVGAIRERLDTMLSLLTNGPLDLPPRMRALRETIRASYDSLDHETQRIFRAASIFEGTFTIAALQAMTRTSPDLSSQTDGLTELIMQSLLEVPSEPVDEPRARMLEPFRAFGRAELQARGEDRRVTRALLTWYGDTLEARQTELVGPNQATWMRFLDLESRTIVSIIRAAAAFGDMTAEALRTTTLMSRYWTLQGQYSFAAELLTTLLDQGEDVATADRTVALKALGTLYYELGDALKAQDCYQRSLELARKDGDRDLIADGLNNMGLICMRFGEDEEAEAHLLEALAIRRNGGDRASLPSTLCNLGDIASKRGDYEKARTWHEEAYRIRIENHNDWGIALSCYSLMRIAYMEQRYDIAERFYEAGIAHAQDVGDGLFAVELNLMHARVAVASHQTERARLDILRCVARLRTMEGTRIVADSVGTLAVLCHAVGQSALAAQIVGNYVRITQGSVRTLGPRDAVHPETVSDITRVLGDVEMHRNLMVGLHQTLDAMYVAIDDALVSEGTSLSPVDSHDDDTPAENPLTRRETQVLVLVAQGLGDKAIATELRISPRTAMTHVSNIMSKLKVHSRSAASRAAVSMGLIEDPGVIEFPDEEG